MRHFMPLTSLRLFLALWVLCRHWFYRYEGSGPLLEIGFSSTFFDHGYLGVDGFFVLSGFILAHNYDPSPGRKLDWSAFLVARIARIYPVYVVCLFVMAVAVIARDTVLQSDTLGSGRYSASGFFLEFFMLNAWRYAGAGGWNDVGWSVSAEWFAYVWFPIFLLVAPRLNRKRLFSMAVCMVAILATVELTSSDHLSLSGGLARLVPEFMLGVLLCRLRETLPNYQGARWGGLCSSGVCVIGVVLWADTIVVIGAAGLIFSLSYKKDALTDVLSLRALVFLGEVSYCIYIVQRIPQYLFKFARYRLPDLEAMPGVVQALLLFGLTLAAAIFLHFAIEKPMRAWINRRLRRNEREGSSKTSQVA
ncbi:acyltransferase (plasmid) [Cupriavidus sp. P-10]|uniref:acyltransferase family protein n=1 Tax=Cupriavidus sp. P-10 TaxID=2027911 RepID=UPI000E2EF818|nr:acyltransferase [Cupriavidus sp. P-10]BDB28824.1 acyltransferase [Cupriavidus sp. P-10]